MTEQHPHRPLDSGALRRVFPFAAAAILGVATLIVPSAQHDKPLVTLALALTAALIAAGLILPWRRLPAVCQAVPPFVYFAIVLILRHAEGGAASGMSPLLMIPYFWIALYGSRLKLPPSTVRALRGYARSSGLTIGVIVTRALDAFVGALRRHG